MLNWPVKDPNEVLDYEIDWTDRLVAGETISSYSWITESGTITIDSHSQAAGVVTAWLSGGTHGSSIVLTNRIVTNQGRTYDQSVRLRIKSTAG